MPGPGRKPHPRPLVKRNVTIEAEHEAWIKSRYKSVSGGVRACIAICQMIEESFGALTYPEPAPIEGKVACSIKIEKAQDAWVTARHSHLSSGLDFCISLAMRLEGKFSTNAKKSHRTVDAAAARQ